MPVTDGVMEYVRVPVPPETTNAVEVSARPKVVVMLEPEAKDSAPLTVNVIGDVTVAPTESVAVIVS